MASDHTCSADAGGNCAECTQTISSDDRCIAMCGRRRCRRWRADGETMCHQHMRTSQAAASSSSARKRVGAVSSSQDRTIDLTGSDSDPESKSVSRRVERKVEARECCVCGDKLTPDTSAFLPCFHPLCETCYANIANHADAKQRRCPLCKLPFFEDAGPPPLDDAYEEMHRIMDARGVPRNVHPRDFTQEQMEAYLGAVYIPRRRP